MSWLDVVVLLVAGTAAGTINTVVGSGSLITFPALLALGYPPVIANVTNNIGVFPGGVSGAFAYRRELKGQWRALLPLAAFSFTGGLAGAILLLILPASAFDAIVPVLIIVACVLVIASPWLKRWASSRQADAHATPGQRVALRSGAGLTGVYGGYFGAAQGVILLALLSILLPGDLNKANAYKNVLAAMANGAAAVVFVFTGKIDWLAALIIAIGAIAGGQIGATIGRRLPALVYRIVIVVIGVAAVVYFYTK
ncbi:MAG: sulfite exporter TauE/SafE family protein [Microbacteriaceae bacterium]